MAVLTLYCIVLVGLFLYLDNNETFKFDVILPCIFVNMWK